MRSMASPSTAARCLLLLAVFSSASRSDRVPVLVWTNDPSVTFPQHLVGHSISRHEFQKSYVKDLTSHNQDNVVLFMQDKLSVADFAHFSDVYNSDKEKNSFTHVKALMSEMSSAFLPSVSAPADVLKDVKNLKSRKVKIVDDLRDVSLESDEGPRLIIVRLPELPRSRKSFGHLDNMIGIVSSQLNALTRPFIAFYTAALSSQGTASQGHRQGHRQGRRLMQDSGDVSEIFVNASDMFYFYTQNLTFSYSGGNSFPVTGLNVDSSNTDCNSTGSCEIVLKFTATGSLYENQIRFQFNITSDSFWYLSLFAFEYKATANGDWQTVEYPTDFVYQTPLGLSYHCNNLPAIAPVNGSTASAPFVQFTNFQIQPFVSNAGRFGHYNDCVGFFTAGTWMFLISSAILITVLFFGVIMLLNITTHDRFDDSKGKTITINTADG